MITSTRNPTIRNARKLAGKSSRGDQTGFLVEGPQAVGAVLARPGLARIPTLFVTPQAAGRHPGLVEAARRTGTQIIEVAPPVLASLAATVTPQGVIAVAQRDNPDLGQVLDEVRDRSGFVVVCEQVRDPGNLGTIVRTSDAAGAAAVVVTSGSVNVHNDKAVRATAGSLFHLPVVSDVDVTLLVQACHDRQIAVVAADAHATMCYTDADFTRPTALVFGNEAQGLSQTALALCDAVVAIPIHGGAESLNLAAAAAICCYEAARQRAAVGVAG